jgi:hypothetical protein
MDPEAALKRARAAIERYTARAENDDTRRALDAAELVDAFESLDGWLSMGGYLPIAWSKVDSEKAKRPTV